MSEDRFIRVSCEVYYRLNKLGAGGETLNELIEALLNMCPAKELDLRPFPPPKKHDDGWEDGVIIELKPSTALLLLAEGNHMEEYDSVIQRLIKDKGDPRFVHRTLFKPQLPGRAHIPPLPEGIPPPPGC